MILKSGLARDFIKQTVKSSEYPAHCKSELLRGIIEKKGVHNFFHSLAPQAQSKVTRDVVVFPYLIDYMTEGNNGTMEFLSLNSSYLNDAVSLAMKE